MGAREELEALRRLDALEKKRTSSPRFDYEKLKYAPTQGMSGGERFAAAYGGVVPKLVEGAGQMMGMVPQAEVDESKRLNEPLMQTTGGKMGDVAGNAMIAAGTGMIPGAGGIAGGGMAGGVLGGLQPTSEGESRLTNTAIGAGAGAGGQAAGKLLAGAIRPVMPGLNAEQAALARAAMKEGIPLTAGDITGSRPLQTIESVMENLPLTSGPQLAKKEAKQRAFTAAVLRKGGMQGDVADAGTLLTQKNALGKTMEGVADSNSLDFKRARVNADISRIVADAEAHMPPADAAKLKGTVDQIFKQIDQSGEMLGTNYQGWREPLRRLAKQGDAPSHYYGQIRKALDDAFAGGLTGKDAATFKGASRQYANTKTIIDAMGGPGALPAQGQVAPNQLGAALARSIGKEGKALGRGDLNELSRVGQTFVKDNIPNSGTAQRAFFQRFLENPVNAAWQQGVGGISRPLQKIMNSNAGQQYLMNGVLPITKKQQEALAAAIRGGAIGMGVSE